MKVTLTAGGTADVDDAKAHVMMAAGEAVRETVPDQDAPKKAKKAKAKKK